MNETLVRTFAANTLRTGLRRVVSACAAPGERPNVRIALFDGERRLSRIFIHAGSQVELVERALAAVDDPDLRGTRVIGELVTLRDVVIVVLAKAYPHHDPAVVFGRRRVETGETVGTPTTLAGTELEGLRHACAWVRDIAAHGPADDAGDLASESDGTA